MTRWILGVACLATAYAWADPATGWKQSGSGPYVYSDPVNWVDGEVNGVFGSDLTLSDDQTIVFGSDAEISGLDISFSGSKTLTLASERWRTRSNLTWERKGLRSPCREAVSNWGRDFQAAEDSRSRAAILPIRRCGS